MNNKTKQLLDLLEKKSMDGSIIWERTPDDNSFRAWIADGAIRIGTWIDESQRSYFSASFINKRDEVVDEIVAFKDEEGLTQSAFTQLENIFNAARRKARGADELLNSMLGQLAKA